jgi:hypothetical protein
MMVGEGYKLGQEDTGLFNSGFGQESAGESAVFGLQGNMLEELWETVKAKGAEFLTPESINRTIQSLEKRFLTKTTSAQKQQMFDEVQRRATENGTKPTGPNWGLIAAIGGGVLVLGVIAILLLRK